MIFHPAPGQSTSSSVPVGAVRPFKAASAQRIRLVQYQEERLRNGVSPATLAGMTALLAQLEAQQTLPSMALLIVVDVSDYKRTMICLNGVWDGYDLTNQFQHDRYTAVYVPRSHTFFEQEASIRMLPRVTPVQTVALQCAKMTNKPYCPYCSLGH